MNLENIKYCLYNFGLLPVDLTLFIRKCKYLNNLLAKNDMFSEIFVNVIEEERDIIISDWKKMANNLSYPCKVEAWDIFYVRTFGL